MSKVTELFLYQRGKYYYIDYILLDEEESESKFETYKAVKYSTFKAKLDSLLKENTLV